jgi:hypothetical protein
MEVFPVPGSPINIGFLFFLLAKICVTLFISFSLPITGSISPFSTAAVISRQKLVRAGVFLGVGFFGLLMFDGLSLSNVSSYSPEVMACLNPL